MLELAIAAFTTLFVTVGPVEVAAIFLSVTPRETAAQRRKTAISASIVAAAVLIAFALGGRSCWKCSAWACRRFARPAAFFF